MARYALIIGIAEYVGSFKSLETPVQNANAIAEILDRYGDFNQVRRLPFRRQAGQKDLGVVIRKPLPHATLVQELQQFLQDANGSDVLLYYSGHGFTKLDSLSQTPRGFLAPSDCQVELNANGQIIAERNGISLAGLNALINRHTFNSLVVILDCCNSGAFLESSMVQRDVTAFGYERDYYLITACRSSSKSYEGEEYSLLTAAVLKGLSQANAAPGTGRISGDRLFDVIGNELQNSRQEPIRMGWGRLITLVRYLQLPETTESVAQSFNPANPYMGLKPFEREQAEYFFGREQSVRSLLERLNENRFLAVIGPSGCGKSSLVKAGLLPELENNYIPGSRDWQIEIITPGQYPLQALTNALERHRADEQPLVLFVDQFEELFTLCLNEEEQRRFIKRLNQETSDPSRGTRIIIALRGDFLDRCAKFQESADLINSTAPTTYMVIPLTEAKLVGELEESITCPAALHGVSFESGLVARIIDDVINQPGAMPLLQYALTQLWEHCISSDGASRRLTLQGYEAIEGVKGALQRWADQFYTNLSPNDQAFVRELISELVQLGDQGEVTRRRASKKRLRELASSQEQRDRILDQLVYQRLLVTDDKTVEVAHEALLKESRLIQGWIEDNRESIRLQQRLEIYRREWEEHDRSENYLLDAGRLAAIDEWIERKQPRLTNADQEFIGLSRGRRDRLFQAQLEQERRLREEAERRELAEIEKKLEAEARAEAESERTKEAEARVKAEKRGKRILLVTGVFVFCTVSLGFLVQLRQWQVNEQQALVVGSLIGKAQQLLETKNELEALTASVEALAELKKTKRKDFLSLGEIQTVIAKINERNRFKASENRIYGLSSHPEQGILAFGGSDAKVRVLDLTNNTISSPIQGHKDLIRVIRFKPDGISFASGSLDKTIKIWSIKGEQMNNLVFKDKVYDISFSPDGRLVAASGNSESIMIWNIKNNTLNRILNTKKVVNKNTKIYGLDFHPINNSILVSSGYGDYDIEIWNLNQKPDSNPKRIGQTTSITESVRFSKDGKMIVSCNDDGIINIRNSEGALIGKINTGDNFAFYAEFSPDSKLIASVSTNNIVKIWSVDEAVKAWKRYKGEITTPFKKLETSTSSINRISFVKPTRSEYQLLATASENGNIGIWDISDQKGNKNQYDVDSLLLEGCRLLENYMWNYPKKLEKVITICAYTH